MAPQDCNRFDSCSAPLCPLVVNDTNGDIWFPDEEICQSQAFSQELWIRNQKKIAKQAKNLDFYFTHKMLSQNCIVKKGIEGLDPYRTSIDDHQAVNKWLKAHPEKREISEKEREEARKRMLELKRGSNLSENCRQRQEINSNVASKPEEKHITNKSDTKLPLGSHRGDICTKNAV